MAEVNLPEGWNRTTLAEVAEWGSGGTPSRKEASYYEGSIPWVKTGDLGPKVITSARENISELAVQNSSAKYFPKGSVAIAMYGATIGKTSILGIDATTNQACSVGNPIDRLTFSEFLYYFLLNEKDNFIAKGKGGAQPNISQALIKEHEIALPPLAEQKIIADKLDTLLAQVETTKARLERILEILKTFRQSVLAAAVSGKLTQEWRSDYTFESYDYSNIATEERKLKNIRETKHSKIANVEHIPFEIPEYWQWFRLGNLALKITDGAHNTPRAISEGFPYIMAKDLTMGFLDFSEGRYISEKEHRELYLKCAPERDDLLIVNIGAGTGNNVLVDVDFEFSFKNIAIIKRPSFILGKYLKFFFDSQKQRIFDEQTRGGAQPFLSLTVLNDLAFALPPLEEQTEIIRRVEELFVFAYRIEQKANAALERVNNLTQSILAKAFRGELTADWRAENPDLISGDNSAKALLEKIKTEREAERRANKGKKRVTRKVKPEKDIQPEIFLENSVVDVINKKGSAKPQEIFDELKELMDLREVLKEISQLLEQKVIKETDKDGQKYLEVNR